MRVGVILCFAATAAFGQLIPAGQPVPKSSNPPVVFVSGYQADCSGSDFASNFGAADQILKANAIVTLFFDNCTLGGTGSQRPTIEAEGVAFGQFLGSLKYTDSTPVTQLDIVAHSMGGLIVRSYLAGKQDVNPAKFLPPPTVPIRRAVFLGTPHFGTTIAAALGSDVQTREMSPGSQFLFDLNTWNQGSDDLRGIQALAVSGNGGSNGQESGIAGFDDGVVTLTSSSMGFDPFASTRIVPYCHTANTLLVIFGYCSSGTPVLNIFNTDPNSMTGQIVTSFLTGTGVWMQLGQASIDNSLLLSKAGAALQLRDQNDLPVQVIAASVTNQTPAVPLAPNSSSGIAYSEALPASTPLTFQISPLSGAMQTATITLPATTELAAVVKPGPAILPHGIVPAAGKPTLPLAVAPGAYVSIYGSNLATSAAGLAQPYPLQIGDVQVLVNGNAAPLQYAGAGQINMIFPDAPTGLSTITVKNMNGQNTLSVMVAASVPSIFLLDANSTAAAVDVTAGKVVGPSAPLHAGDYVSIYLTGLGATFRKGNDGLDYAVAQPTLTVGGQNCAITYAGRSPGFAGLDQINCQLPVGTPVGGSIPVSVAVNGRVSNTAFVAVQ